MKKLLLIFMFPFFSFAQHINDTIGESNLLQVHKEGVQFNSTLTLPERSATVGYTGQKVKGLLQINNFTGKLQYNDGSGWLDVVDLVFIQTNFADKVSYRTKSENDLLYKSISYAPTKSEVGLSNADNTSDLSKPISIAMQTALNGKFNIPSGTTTQYLRGDGSLSTFPSIPLANNYTAGNGIVITGTAPNLTISVVQPTVTVVTSKVLNSNFTISTTKPAIVSYAVSCTVTNPLLIGTSTATAYLEYSLNSGTTWLNPSQSGNSSGVGVTVAIQLTNTQTGTLTGVIPANALARIRTATTGTASVNYVTGTEITY